MKKLFALLFSSILLLTGCVDKTTISYYTDNGYTDIGEIEGYNALQKEITENETMYLGYTNEDIKLFTAVYETGEISIAFYSTLSGETCSANVLDEEGSSMPVVPRESVSNNFGTTSCSNAFAYYMKYAPDLANEINDLIVNFDLNEEVIKNGDVAVIEDMIISFN